MRETFRRDDGATAETPSQAIQRLARARASGELVIAADSIEIHVYVLDGRLAWATSSNERNGFTRRLVEHHQVAPDALREVIQECQRAHKRLGETIIGWGLATQDQVKDALRAQIVAALSAAALHPGAQSLFLPRRMDYAHELTFALDDLIEPTPVPSPSEAGAGIVDAVLEAMPEAVWVNVVAANGPIAAVARGAVRPGGELRPVQAVLGGGTDAIAIRTARGSILGQRIEGQDASVWCALGPDAKLGVASVVLACAAGNPTGCPAAPPLDELWRERTDPRGMVPPSVFASAMRTSDDLLAAFALSADGGASGTWRLHDFDDHVARARTLLPVLTANIYSALPREESPLVYDQIALRAVTPDAAYFGTTLSGASPWSVWLAMRPQASQGLGWALLQAVARQVGDLGGGGR